MPVKLAFANVDVVNGIDNPGARIHHDHIDVDAIFPVLARLMVEAGFTWDWQHILKATSEPPQRLGRRLGLGCTGNRPMFNVKDGIPVPVVALSWRPGYDCTRSALGVTRVNANKNLVNICYEPAPHHG